VCTIEKLLQDKIDFVRKNISNWMERMSNEFADIHKRLKLVRLHNEFQLIFQLDFPCTFFTVLLADELWDCDSDTSKVKVFFLHVEL
jgi:hypothetical protein